MLAAATSRHVQRMMDDHGARSAALAEGLRDQMERMTAPEMRARLTTAWTDYLRDSGERMVLTLDALRQRGDIFLEHEEAGCPPVLAHD